MNSTTKFHYQVLLFISGMLLTSGTSAEDRKENIVYELAEPTTMHEVLSIYRLLAADERKENNYIGTLGYLEVIRGDFGSIVCRLHSTVDDWNLHRASVNKIYIFLKKEIPKEIVSVFLEIEKQDKPVLVEIFGTYHISSGYGAPCLSDVDCVSIVKR